MAKDIQSIERTTLTPTQNVSGGNSFDRLGEATTGLANMISSKLNEVGVDMAAQQGEKDALSGDAPKSLAPGFNKTTRAYNNAVSQTEARHQVISARSQISEEYIKATDPANFNADSPAVFKAKLQGIVDGTLESTRESNKPKVALALEQLSAEASVDMLKHSIDFDNKQLVKTMSSDIDQLVKDRRNAAIEGNAGNVTAIDEMIHETLANYGEQNAVVRRMIPDINKKLEQNAEVDKVLGDFSHAASDGSKEEFLSKLASNEQKLDHDTWMKATKEIIALDVTEQNLKFQQRSFEKQSVVNGIDNNTITTNDEIRNFPNLTAVDQLVLDNHLRAHKEALAKSQYNLVEAQKNIVHGNPGFNSTAQKNTMFTNARHTFEEVAKQPMAIGDMWDSINGRGPVPASGIPGVSMGSDVPQFNDQLTSQLTSKDPTQVAQASMIFNDAVNVQKTPNLINLKGDALAIASHFNTMNIGGVDPIALAERVSTTTLDAGDPEFKIRSERFTNELANSKQHPHIMNSNFKATFDTSYTPGVSDNAMGVFKETLREQFMLSGNADAALAATKYEMRAWGSSKYFEAGMVGQPVPEKELSIANIGYAFDNQLRINAQLVINQNKLEREINDNLTGTAKDANPFTIEWAKPDQDINLTNLSQKDRVFAPLGQSTSALDYFADQSKPKVKVNGNETELFLMPTSESRLGERVQYAVFYHDKFGMVQPVPDASTPSGMAMFSPVGMEKWAPAVMKDENAKEVKAAALKFQKDKAMNDWEALSPGGAIGRMIEEATFGLGQDKDHLGTEEQKAEIARKYFAGDAEYIEKFMTQNIQGKNAATIPAEAKEADHVGIAADQSPVTEPATAEIAADKVDNQSAKVDKESTPTSSESNKVVDAVVKALPKTEGSGSNVKGDVSTGEFGITNAALKELGVDKKVSELTGKEQREFGKQFVELKYNELSKKLTNFSSAPEQVQQAVLHAAYNIGATRTISKMNRFAKNDNWLGGMKELLKISTSDGKTLLGLAKRRAQEYNEVAGVDNQPLIKFVEQKRKSVNFIGSDGDIIFTLIKPRHPQSKIQKIAVPKLGSGE